MDFFLIWHLFYSSVHAASLLSVFSYSILEIITVSQNISYERSLPPLSPSPTHSEAAKVHPQMTAIALFLLPSL